MVFGYMLNIGVTLIITAKLCRKALFQVIEVDTVLGPGRAGHTGHHRRQIEFDDLRVFGLTGIHVKKSLLSGIGFNDFSLVDPVGHFEVIDGFFIDGEKAQGGTVFRSHVGQRGPIGNRQVFHAGPKKFHKFFNHIVLAQQFGNGQYQIGCRRAGG